MNFPSLSSALTARALLLGSLLLVAGCTTPTTKPTAPAAAPAPAVAVGAYDDDPRALTANEAAVIAAGLDPAKQSALERTLLATLQQPGALPDARQDAAHKLGLVLNSDHAEALAALAPLLADPARSDNARLALDRVSGPQVDTLYLSALPTATGRARLGIIDSIGTRRIATAVPALAHLLNDADPATADAAASALGRIGGSASLTALASAKDQLAPAVLNARLTAAARVDAATLARTAGEIYRNPSAPLASRSAALRALIAANPSGAVDEIHAALSGTERAFHATALESVAKLPAAAQLAGRLDSYVPAVQVALIAALGSRGDAAAVPGLLKVLDSADAEVRLTAIDALGRLPGTTDTAQRLAVLASGTGAEAKAAFASLARLNGPGVDNFIRTSAATGDAALQPVFIQQLAARNQTEAIPFLLGLRSSPVEPLRLEALDALRLIAAPTDQQAVIDWAVGASAKTEQTRAVRALITIILRDGVTDTRAAPLIAALETGDAAARQTLLPVLSRITGPAALATAGALARNADEAVAVAATAELTRWPDASALPVLVDLAVATKVETVRTAAVQGAARFLAQNSPENKGRRSVQTRTLLDLPASAPTRQTLLNVLSLCADQAALDTARHFLADPALAAEAQDAVDAITSSLAGPPVVTASDTSANPALMADGSTETFWQVPANEAGTWIRADLHSTRPVRKVTLDHRGRGWGYPAPFDVQVSDNPDQPGAAVAQGEGGRGPTVVTLPAGTRGRYVWLRLTGRRDAPLAISELLVE